mgnify:CR=1 FL=1
MAHVGLTILGFEGRGVAVGVGVFGWGSAVVESGSPGLEGLAVMADAREAAISGEDDPAVSVVPGVLLVVAKDWELGTVDGTQFVCT